MRTTKRPKSEKPSQGHNANPTKNPIPIPNATLTILIRIDQLPNVRMPSTLDSPLLFGISVLGKNTIVLPF